MQYLEDCILSHPDFPSLLSITDTPDKYKIENLAVKVDFDKLYELPLPCIVQVSDRGSTLFHTLDAVPTMVTKQHRKIKVIFKHELDYI